MNRICGILICGIFLISLLLIPQYSVEIYDVSRVSPATKQEVLDFLAQDATNSTAYNWVTYNCLNFAVDLWRNAYLAGFDAFIIIINKNGILSHASLGFYAEGNDAHTVEYWAREDEKQWFHIDPQRDSVFSRGDSDDLLDKRNMEIIAFLYGEDAFALWQEVSNRTLIKDDLIHFYLTIALYKTQKLFNTN